MRTRSVENALASRVADAPPGSETIEPTTPERADAKIHAPVLRSLLGMLRPVRKCQDALTQRVHQYTTREERSAWCRAGSRCILVGSPERAGRKGASLGEMQSSGQHYTQNQGANSSQAAINEPVVKTDKLKIALDLSKAPFVQIHHG